jgi:hypothetical protein
MGAAAACCCCWAFASSKAKIFFLLRKPKRKKRKEKHLLPLPPQMSISTLIIVFFVVCAVMPSSGKAVITKLKEFKKRLVTEKECSKNRELEWSYAGINRDVWMFEVCSVSVDRGELRMESEREEMGILKNNPHTLLLLSTLRLSSTLLSPLSTLSSPRFTLLTLFSHWRAPNGE